MIGLMIIIKINNTELPSHDLFYSKMKDNNMKTFEDFLELYDNLDVLPSVEAVEKMKECYNLKRLDAFNDRVSLPGFSIKIIN